jgi:hypothetical protein
MAWWTPTLVCRRPTFPTAAIPLALFFTRRLRLVFRARHRTRLPSPSYHSAPSKFGPLAHAQGHGLHNRSAPSHHFQPAALFLTCSLASTEPMLTEGHPSIFMLDDGWTVVTKCVPLSSLSPACITLSLVRALLLGTASSVHSLKKRWLLQTMVAKSSPNTDHDSADRHSSLVLVLPTSCNKASWSNANDISCVVRYEAALAAAATDDADAAADGGECFESFESCWAAAAARSAESLPGTYHRRGGSSSDAERTMCCAAGRAPSL